ncbi:hypothetical protein AZK53_15790 [Priestia megaterium]|nr:hypothetical protein AZK53_15790 [Priestia megaterium]
MKAGNKAYLSVLTLLLSFIQCSTTFSQKELVKKARPMNMLFQPTFLLMSLMILSNGFVKRKSKEKRAALPALFSLFLI